MKENTSKSAFAERSGSFEARYYVEVLRLDREHGSTTTLLLEVLHTKKLCGKLYSNELKFYSQKQPIRILSYPLGELGVKYALHL